LNRGRIALPLCGIAFLCGELNKEKALHPPAPYYISDKAPFRGFGGKKMEDYSLRS